MSAAVKSPLAVTRKVSVGYLSDGGPTRHRIGLIALDSDVATEYDFHRMLPDDVMFYTTRIPCPNPITVENLRLQGPMLTDVVKQILPNQRLDVIAYSCTSGTVAIGYENVVDYIRAGGRGDLPVITPVTSAAAALTKVGAKRISLMTPYIDSVNEIIRDFLLECGFEVLNIGSFCLDDDISMAELDPEAIYEAALETCRPEADALFISCTAIRAVQVLERLEQALNKPVVSSIQTLFWQSLRESGYRKPVEGLGSLMRM